MEKAEEEPVEEAEQRTFVKGEEEGKEQVEKQARRGRDRRQHEAEKKTEE